MLAGRPAFSGNSAIEIFHSILYDSPPALTGSPAISAIDRIVQRGLAKNAEERYFDADVMAAELRAGARLDSSATTVEVRTIKRLIILPFKPLRPDSETDFLAFSLPDAIAGSLAGLSSLVVRSTLAARDSPTRRPICGKLREKPMSDASLPAHCCAPDRNFAWRRNWWRLRQAR